MSDPQAALAATFVEPRGMIRSVVAGAAGTQVAGAAGSLAAHRLADGQADDAAPLRRGQIGCLVAYADAVVLFRAKRGAFKPKATDEVLASAPRASVSSAVIDRGRIAGRMTIAFTDGSTWEFDVPKVHLGGAQQIAAQLS